MNAFPQGLHVPPLRVETPVAVPAAQPRRAPKQRLGPGTAAPYGALLGPGLLLLYWCVLSATGWLDPRILPAPWTAVTTGVDLIQEGRLQQHLAVSAARAMTGLSFGITIGAALALLSGLSLLGGYVIDGLVQIKRGVPILALIPFMILWLGIGETMKITLIATAVFIPVYINTHNALRAIDIRHVELAETVRLSRWQFLRHVVVPGALPGFLTGLRFGVTSSWLALVVVEQLNATSGIGYMVTLARNYAQTDVMLVGLVVYALLGFGSDALVRQLERRLLSWRRTLGR
ncbi:ABC transporter permease [Sphingomonas carotinifaciens]|uniref:ABC transporter permease subunit n=1 Tax=Sphingomonas carotinifaciens TaxID=1166323 RepID=A0A1G7RXQ9_9SPHN|nr:ABC transporter permease [Sphingomonas carotinifaciens]MBB4084445.1 sulfonate transport system permease protein [Sphingomonas carotinifaciens]MWC43846.1 ABC transporter permease subunit [Sphingomonas carotinifaciens]SDG15555.1 sulfonate transport system permease protein [Sphingomonas carotinifaciens]